MCWSDVQLPLDVNEPVSVCVKHCEQVLRLFVGDLQLGDLLNGLLELLGSQRLLVEDVVLQIVYIGEEVLEQGEAVRAAGVRPELTVLLIEPHEEADHHHHDPQADQHEPVPGLNSWIKMRKENIIVFVRRK